MPARLQNQKWRPGNKMYLRACLKIARGAVFVKRAGWRGVTKENTLHGSSTEEQQSQTALCAKTFRRRGASRFPSRGHCLQRRAPFSDRRTRQRGIAALQTHHIQSKIKKCRAGQSRAGDARKPRVKAENI